jgi:hypothetical protein
MMAAYGVYEDAQVYDNTPETGERGDGRWGLLPGFEGIEGHNCWKGYWAYRCEHRLCNAHVLRELTGVIERTGAGMGERDERITIGNERGGRMISG